MRDLIEVDVLRVLLFVVIPTTLVGGCDSAVKGTGRVTPVMEEMIGTVIVLSSKEPRFTVPDTVDAGQPFPVRVRTYWPDGCAEGGDLDTKVGGETATMTPIDFRMHRAICSEAIQHFDHSDTLRFDRPGRATVVLRGRSLPGDSLGRFSRQVVVL